GSGCGHDLGRVAVHNRLRQRLQTKRTVSDPADRHEQEADRIAEQVTQGPHSPPFAGRPSTVLSHSEPLVQRLVTNEAGMEAETSAPQEGAAPEGTASGLIVEDDARDLGPGQMRKSEFLDQLRTSACAVADEELARAGRSTDGCPYIGRAFARYRTRSSQYLERALRHFAPEAAGVTTAREYIPLVSERIRQGV